MFSAARNTLFLAMTLSFLTLNTGGCSDSVKNASLLSYVQNIAHNPDIIFLQETYNLMPGSPCWNLWNLYHVNCSPSTSRGSGLTTIVKKKQITSFDSSVIVDGNILYSKTCIDDTIYHLYNILIPHDDNCALKAIQSLHDHLCTIHNGIIVLGGDFNCTLNPALDRLGMPKEHRPKISTSLGNMIEFFTLCDVSRKLNPTQKVFTWHRTNPRCVNGVSRARLDRFYLPVGLMPSFHKCTILACSLSDHDAVYFELKSPQSRRTGSAYWHFNNSLLDDKNYQDIVLHFWSDWKLRKNDFDNILMWWDAGKSHIRIITQMYGKKKAAEKRASFLKLNNTLDKLHALSSCSSDTIQEMNTKKNELNNLLKYEAKGALIRSRFKLIQETDTSSSFFYNLEKSNSSRKRITRIRLPSGRTTVDESEIKNHVHSFYKKLYSLTPIDCVSDELTSNIKCLDENDQKDLDAPFSLEELTQAVKHLGKGKTAGMDGLTTEFYQTFWPILKNDFFEVIHHSILCGNLPRSFRRAIISLIPKKGDLADITNWRPVSLLNVDYKIFAKTLANRLKQCIGSIILEDQTYCIPGRTIYDNVILIRDIIHYANSSDVPLALINLDQKKAFDNVSHEYLFHIMKTMGFGDSFISNVKLLYCQAESLVKVCGSLTAPFSFQKGIRQGCPLSGMLYSIALEPFLRLLRHNLSQCNLKIPEVNLNVSVSAYADDVTVFISNNNGFDIIQDVFKIYSKSSNACLNYNKSKGLWTGSWCRRSDKPLGCQWSSEGLTFLGVHLGNTNIHKQQNWIICKDKLKNTLSRWTPLSNYLSYKGKVLVANQLAATKVFHFLATLAVPQHIVNELQDMLVNFIWSNKRHLIKKKILSCEPSNGGLGLASLQARVCTFRFCFLQRFLNLCPHPVYSLCSLNLRKYKGLDFDSQLCFMNLNPKFFTTLQCFYSEVLRAWMTSGAHIDTSSLSLSNVLNIPLNFVSLIPPSQEGSQVFPARLFACGITLIKQIIDPVNGRWRTADTFLPNLVFDTTRQRFSQRLVDKELSILKYRLSITFPAFFTSFGLKESFRQLCTTPNPLLIKLATRTVTVSTKAIYRLMKRHLNCYDSSSSPTFWHESKVISCDTKIIWTEIYAPPTVKKDGDTQYKLLHNVLPSLPVLHHFNDDISPECGWCGEMGTIIHLFIQCPAIQESLNVLHELMTKLITNIHIDFDLYWALVPHASGRCREAVRLCNFLIISFKSTIYWLYRTRNISDPLVVWKSKLKNRIILDYEFFKLQNNVAAFTKRWCVNNAFCSINDSFELTWSVVLS